MLLGLHWQDDTWIYSFDTHAAIPQIDLPAFLMHEEKGLTVDRLWDDTGNHSYLSDGTGFGIITSDGTVYCECIFFPGRRMVSI